MINPYQHLPVKFGRFKDAEDLPLMTVVWVSNRCNSRCGHCPFNLYPELREKDKNAFMPLEIFQKIADDLSLEQERWLRITGAGEPFLNRHLLEFVEYAKGKDIRVGLITNGSLFDDKKIDRLLIAETDIIEISVDAMDKGTYSKIRVGLDFAKVHNDVIKLVKRRKELGSKSKIVVSIINQPIKLPHIPKVVQYWEKIADKVILRKWLTWNVLDNKNFTEPFLDPARRVPCPWPFERMHIATSGDVVFCADDLERKYLIGNVKEKSVSQLWNSKKFERYRQYHLTGRYGMIDICARCKDWPYKSWNYNYHKIVHEFAKGI